MCDTSEAVSYRDSACGGVFDSGYVQLAGLRSQLHADGSPIIHCIVHGCATLTFGGGWWVVDNRAESITLCDNA